jgi:hypothetical protein
VLAAPAALGLNFRMQREEKRSEHSNGDEHEIPILKFHQQ